MLEEVLMAANNWFVHDVKSGKFEISDGNLNADFLNRGQYYKIVGSVFNDGLHKHPDVLNDEEFYGKILLLAIPQSVIELSEKAEKWVETYGKTAKNPYSSESFGGYSYAKDSESKDWKDAFSDELKRWRKV